MKKMPAHAKSFSVAAVSALITFLAWYNSEDSRVTWALATATIAATAHGVENLRNEGRLKKIFNPFR